MTKILLLSGASINSQIWAKEMQSDLALVGKKVSLFEYGHWHDGGEINIDAEVKKLNSFLRNNPDVKIIIAKSAGSIITMKAERQLERTLNNVFIGVPVEYAIEHDIDLHSLVHDNKHMTLCIQAEKDPMGSYDQIKQLIKNNRFMSVKSISGEDHQYSDYIMLAEKINSYLNSIS